MSLLFWRKTRDIAPENAQSVAVTESDPLPVKPSLTDEDDALRVSIDSTVSVDPVTATPTAYNTTCTSADTEYSQALPANCRGFEFQARTEAVVRFAFVTGKVADSTAAYLTLKAGDYYSSPLIAQGASPSTLYVASPTAGTVVEILAWS